MKRDKMENLALDDLDIEEIERRLEMAPATVAEGWCGCGSSDCTTLCAGKITCDTLCGENLGVWSMTGGGGGGGGGC